MRTITIGERQIDHNRLARPAWRITRVNGEKAGWIVDTGLGYQIIRSEGKVDPPLYPSFDRAVEQAEKVWGITPPDTSVGARVRFTAAFLRSTGQLKGPAAPACIGPFARGEVIPSEEGDLQGSVRVLWDDGWKNTADPSTLENCR